MCAPCVPDSAQSSPVGAGGWSPSAWLDLYVSEDAPAESDPEPSVSPHWLRSDHLRGGQTLLARMLWNQRPRDHDDATRQLYSRHGLMQCMRMCISLCVAGLTEERNHILAHWGLGDLAPVCARFACTGRLWYFASRLVFHIANLAPWWPLGDACTDHWRHVRSWFYACPWYIETGEMAGIVHEWNPIMPWVHFEDLPRFPANRLLCCYAGRGDDSDTEAPNPRKRKQPGSDSPSTAAIGQDTFGTPLCDRCAAHTCQCPTPDPDAPGAPPCDSSPDTPPCDRCGAHPCECLVSSSPHLVSAPQPDWSSQSD